MKNEKLKWKTAAVFICTKCGKSIEGAPSDLADNLKSELKGEMKKLGLGKDIRVMTSSCLDICEAGSQAVAIIPTQNAAHSVVKVINPFKDVEALKKEILKFSDL